MQDPRVPGERPGPLPLPPSGEASRPERPLSLLVLLGAALISLLPMLILAAYAFPSADDFCLAVEASGGFWHMQSEHYLKWTGRYTATLLQTLSSRWDLASVYPWFVMATLAATLLSFRSLIGALWEREFGSLQTTAFAAVATAVFVGGLPSVVEAFYWMASATTYQWGLIAYLVWLALLVRIARGSAPAGDRRRRAAAAVLTVLLPGFNEVMAPLVLATLLAFVVAGRRAGVRERFMPALLAIAIVFTAVSLLAPGNGTRSSSYPALPTRHNVEFALTETARQTVRFIVDHGSYTALWFAAFGAWWWGWGPRALRRTDAPYQERHGWSGVLGLALIVYLTLFPLYWEYGNTNYTGEGRTYNITYFVFCAAVIWAVALLSREITGRWSEPVARLRASRGADLILAAVLACLMIASPSTVRSFRSLEEAPAYLRAQRAREAVLRTVANRGGAALVPAIHVRPDGLFWGDLQPDPSHWINSCVADYYGLRSVQAGS